MKRVFVIILAIAAAAMGCRAQEVVEINSTRQAVKRTGDALLVAMPLATLTAVIVERDWQGLKQAAFSTATTRSVVSVEVYGAQDAPRPQ